MNEQLQEQLAEVVRKSFELAEKTGEFAIEKAPELIYQFLMWEAITSILFVLFVSVPLFWVWFKFKNWITKGENVDTIFELDGDAGPVAALVALFTLVIGTIVGIIQTTEVLKIIFVPELYLIQTLLQ